MLIDLITKGSTDRSVLLRIIDSTDGTPETGVVFNTSGIDLWYRREGAVKTSVTEATLSALTDAHADGGFLHVGDGYYRLDLPDAAFATGANYVDVGGTVTGMVVIGGRVKLINVSLEDAVRGGMTALPNANAEAAGGLYTRGTGAGQINQANNGQIDANAARTGGTTNTGRDIGASVLLSSGTGTGQVSLSSGAVLLQATQTGVTIPTVTTLTNAPSDSSGVTTLLSRIPSGLFTGITSLAQWLGAMAGKQTGDSTARTEIRATGAGSGTFDETTDSNEAIRDNIGTAGAGLTAIDLPDQTMNITGNITGNLSGSVGSVSGAVGSVTGNVGGNVTGSVGSVSGAVGSVTGNVGGNVTGTVGSLATQAKADVNAEVVDALATDTYAEPGQGAPAATATLAAKINYLYKAWRNKKTQTASTYSLFADDTTTVDQKATVSDDGTTTTVGEIATGP